MTRWSRTREEAMGQPIWPGPRREPVAGSRPQLGPIDRGDAGAWLATGGDCAMADAAREWMAHVDAGRMGGH